MMMDVWIIWMDAICLQSFRAKRSERESERTVLKEGENGNGEQLGTMFNDDTSTSTHTHI